VEGVWRGSKRLSRLLSLVDISRPHQRRQQAKSLGLVELRAYSTPACGSGVCASQPRACRPSIPPETRNLAEIAHRRRPVTHECEPPQAGEGEGRSTLSDSQPPAAQVLAPEPLTQRTCALGRRPCGALTQLGDSPDAMARIDAENRCFEVRSLTEAFSTRTLLRANLVPQAPPPPGDPSPPLRHYSCSTIPRTRSVDW
jgi:hypothetical protein